MSGRSGFTQHLLFIYHSAFSLSEIAHCRSFLSAFHFRNTQHSGSICFWLVLLEACTVASFAYPFNVFPVNKYSFCYSNKTCFNVLIPVQARCPHSEMLTMNTKAASTINHPNVEYSNHIPFFSMYSFQLKCLYLQIKLWWCSQRLGFMQLLLISLVYCVNAPFYLFYGYFCLTCRDTGCWFPQSCHLPLM